MSDESTTTTKPRGGRPKKAETEMRELDERIAAFQAELEAGPEELGWAVSRNLSPEEVGCREREKSERQFALPRLIKAAKARRLELDVRRREEKASATREEGSRSHGVYEGLQEKFLQAQQDRAEARAQWSNHLNRHTAEQERVRTLKRELRELKEGGGGIPIG